MMENSLNSNGFKFAKALSISALIGLFSIGSAAYADNNDVMSYKADNNAKYVLSSKADETENPDLSAQESSNLTKKNTETKASKNGGSNDTTKDSSDTSVKDNPTAVVCTNNSCHVARSFSDYTNIADGEVRGGLINQALKNKTEHTYPDIIGQDMYNNIIQSTKEDVNGGLIYNGIIGYSSTANFLTINNKMYDNTITAAGNVRGGLVYNGNVYQNDKTNIASLTSDMTGNSVTAGGNIYGGLIYNFSAGSNSSSSIGTDAQNIYNGTVPNAVSEEPGTVEPGTVEPGEATIWDGEITPAVQKVSVYDNPDLVETETKDNINYNQLLQKRAAQETELPAKENNATNENSGEKAEKDIVTIFKPAVERKDYLYEAEAAEEEMSDAVKNELPAENGWEREKEELTPTELTNEERKPYTGGLTETDKWPTELGPNEGNVIIPGNKIVDEIPSAEPTGETTFNGIQGTISGNTIAAGNTVYGGIILNSKNSGFAIYYPGPLEDIPVPLNTATAQISQIDAVIKDNIIEAENVQGGIIYNDGLIGKISGEITNNTINGAGSVIGAILLNKGQVGLGDLVIANNTSNNDGGTIINEYGSVIRILGNTTLTNNTSNGKYDDIFNVGDINLMKNSNLTVTGRIYSNYNPEILGHNAGTIYLDPNSTLNAANEIKGQNIYLDGGTLNLTSFKQADGSTTYGTMDLAHLTVAHGGTINAVNNHVHAHTLGNVMLNGDLHYTADVDLANAKMDSLDALSLNTKEKVMPNIFVNGLNLISDAKDTKTEVYFTNEALKDVVVNNVGEVGYGSGNNYQTNAYSPIYKYNVGYENREDAGYFVFTRGAGNAYGDFNPSVMVSPIATQAAAQSTMNQTFNYVFEHADTFMTLPSIDRVAKLNSNSYALSTDYNENLGALDINQNNRGVWVRPYSAFENMPLKHGPKVDLISYGTFIGFDSDVHRLKHGWANVGTAYIGYNGAQIKYDNVDTSMNGGMIGLTETFYKGNFFTALTATAGAGVADSTTMYGHEDQAFLMGGIGSKTGYNLEFKGGKFIVQPILFMSYSIVKGFDYTNSAGVRVNSDPAHTVQINPSVRFIGNFDGWQPYASVGMVWDVLHESNSEANGVKLPEMYTKPYVQYGVGVQRNVNENFSAFGQAMIRNGGRNGISLTLGFRWAIGKDGKDKVSNPSRKISKNNQHLSMQDEDKTVIKKLSVTQKAHLMNTTRTSMNAIIE